MIVEQLMLCQGSAAAVKDYFLFLFLTDRQTDRKTREKVWHVILRATSMCLYPVFTVSLDSSKLDTTSSEAECWARMKERCLGVGDVGSGERDSLFLFAL